MEAPVIIHTTFDLITASPDIARISDNVPFVSTEFTTAHEGKKLLSVKAISGLNADSMETFRLIVTEMGNTLGITLRYDQDVDSEQHSLWHIDTVIGNIDHITQVEFMIDSSDDYEDPKVGRIAVPKQ